MNRFGQILIVVMAVQIVCGAEIAQLPGDDQKALSEVSHFQPIHSVTNLPRAVFSLCADFNGKLAESGQNWQVSDVVTDATLSWKRLIWAFTDGDYYVVHYESGGRGHSFHVMVCRLKAKANKPSFVWRGVGDKLKDLGDFRDAIKNGKMEDGLTYAH